MGIRSRVRSSKNVKVNDMGLDRILHELDIANRSYTKVGYPAEGEVKGATRKGSGRDEFEDISEVAEVAAINEFGAPNANVPERSFVRTSFDEGQKEINRMKQRLYNQIIDGKMTTKRALGLIGEKHVAQMKRKIRDIKNPPNAPSTKRRKKGVSNPLIDRAQMLNSVQHIEILDV